MGVNGAELAFAEKVMSLGVFMGFAHPALPLEQQNGVLAKTASCLLHLVLQLSPVLDSADLATLICACVALWLGYCRKLYIGLPL